VIKSVGQSEQYQLKAAEQSRTAGHCREIFRAANSARFWSAAVLCRFMFLERARLIQSRALFRIRLNVLTLNV
jgi:hypothetical protein